MRFLFLIVFLSLFSCKPQEKVTPLAKTETVCQRLGDCKNLVFRYTMDDNRIDEFGSGDISKLPVVGDIFKVFKKQFANIFLLITQGVEIEIDPIEIYFPELDEIQDFDFFSQLAIKNMTLCKLAKTKGQKNRHNYFDICEKMKGGGKDFNFLKSIDLYISFSETSQLMTETEREEVFWDGEDDDYSWRERPTYRDESKIKKIRIASYNEKEGSIGCNGNCLNLQVNQELDWKKILEKNRYFTFYLSLKAKSVPSKNMDIGGYIDYSISINKEKMEF